MFGRFPAAVSALVILSSGCSHSPGALKAAAKSLSATQVGTMEVCASGSAYGRSGGAVQTVYDVSNFTVSADYTESTGRLQITKRQRFEPGTLRPFPSEERADEFVADGYAWNLHEPSDGEAGNVPTTQVAQSEIETRTAEMWLYPQGFIRAALKHKATASSGEGGTDVSFTADDIHYVGTIDSDGNVTKVRAWIDNSPQSPVHLEADFSDYRDYQGIRFPRHITRYRDGERELDLTVCSLKTGSAFEIFVPKAVEAAVGTQSGAKTASARG